MWPHIHWHTLLSKRKAASKMLRFFSKRVYMFAIHSCWNLQVLPELWGILKKHNCFQIKVLDWPTPKFRPVGGGGTFPCATIIWGPFRGGMWHYISGQNGQTSPDLKKSIIKGDNLCVTGPYQTMLRFLDRVPVQTEVQYYWTRCPAHNPKFSITLSVAMDHC